MDAPRPDTVSDPIAALRAAGLRVTPQRLAVLRILEAQGGHRTADELAAALRMAGTPLPRASLYHALATMASAGAILVADAGPGTARYEVADAWHHHLVCRRCGAIIDVPCITGAKPCLDAALPGARIDEAQVIFRGLCATCAAADEVPRENVRPLAR
jgi:Fe2+ or Zn2+ uptake regulation protein